MTNLSGANLSGANLIGVDLNKADLQGANLHNVILGTDKLHLMGKTVILSEISIEGAFVKDIQNPPEGFIEWALENRAITERE